jgi:hypothetical protein
MSMAIVVCDLVCRREICGRCVTLQTKTLGLTGIVDFSGVGGEVDGHESCAVVVLYICASRWMMPGSASSAF